MVAMESPQQHELVGCCKSSGVIARVTDLRLAPCGASSTIAVAVFVAATTSVKLLWQPSLARNNSVSELQEQMTVSGRRLQRLSQSAVNPPVTDVLDDRKLTNYHQPNEGYPRSVPASHAPETLAQGTITLDTPAQATPAQSTAVQPRSPQTQTSLASALPSDSYKWVLGAYSLADDPMTMEFCSLDKSCNFFGDVAPMPARSHCALQSCMDAGGRWCSRRPPLDKLFSPVDGGVGRACRRTSREDNENVYYDIDKLATAASFDECLGLCFTHPTGCFGVEHIPFRLEHRCEIWQTRIMATRPLETATCLRHENWLAVPNCCLRGSCGAACKKLGKLGSLDKPNCMKLGGQWCEPASPWYRIFVPVEGGVDRCCRGADETDNSEAYYTIHTLGIKDTITQCKLLCADTAGCQGIEYLELAKGPRCEVWTRPQGIGATWPLRGCTCLRLTR